ncbi:MAG: aldo/keto reductase [Gemmatimonadota bacterium]|nr:aldo/keto reductase [Gemmatimonadota bacterium]
MISRRDWLRISATAGAALSLDPQLLRAFQSMGQITKPIPSSGERVPVIGLGGRWISRGSSAEELAGHRAVLHALAEGGAGRVWDTAAGYGGGASEELSGEWAQEDGFANDIFWATKVNVAGGRGGGGSVNPAAVRAQIDQSFERLRVPMIDLNQVHNMGDPPTQLRVLQEYKDAGRIRYIGITTTSENQYDDLERVMRSYPIDFIGIDYAIDNRVAEERVFPAAIDEGIAVLVYLPFGRSRMWGRIGDLPLPGWAAEFDAHTWAQFMLKFVVAHPAVTVAAPGTGDPEHMVDNIGGGLGRLPNQEHLERMLAWERSL